MKTNEKDIKKFFKTNSPVLSDNKSFMDDLRRQLDLLPTPSSLTGSKSEEEIKSSLDLVVRTGLELKRQFRFRAIASTLVGMLVVFAAGLVLIAIGPEILSTLSSLLPRVVL